MASIFKSSFNIHEPEDIEDMQPLIDNYWGDPLLEKVFPIPLWKMKQLFKAFPSSEVALKVTDIFSTTLVDAQWVAFDESLEAVLSDIEVQPSATYFIFSESDFEMLVDGADEIDENFFLITGRIGKETSTTGTVHYAFICASTLMIRGVIGGGGDGTSSGFKIPSP